MSLNINEIFYSLQGEGPFAGFPAVFVRFAGCNLDCDFCDTDHSATAVMSVEAVAESILHYADHTKLVVITGGEPFLQWEGLRDLVYELKAKGFTIQIESNGTVVPDDVFPWELVQLVISPKYDRTPALIPHATAIKFVLRNEQTENMALVALAKRHNPDIPIYLQPVDDKDEIKNKLNQNWVVAWCLTTGYRLSLQVQKIINVR